MKNSVLEKAEKFLKKKGRFTYRVCKLLKSGEFSNVLSSQELAHLVNDGAGKKIKVKNLNAQMDPLVDDDIVKIKTIGKGKKKEKFWFPGWLDKSQVEQKFSDHLSGSGVLFFTGKNPWTDPNKNFPKLIEMLEGDLCIVDPFYGNGTFFVLEKFGKKRQVRFLSSALGNDEQRNPIQFNSHLKRFKKEFKNIEMKKYNKLYELHDRYIIAENALVIIGHGIKDLADKESFVIFLSKTIVKTFLPTLKRIFEERWRKSGNISQEHR